MNIEISCLGQKKVVFIAKQLLYTVFLIVELNCIEVIIVHGYYNQLLYNDLILGRAPRKHFSWTSPKPVILDKPEKNPFDKISSYQDFTSTKQTLILVNPLSFKNS